MNNEQAVKELNAVIKAGINKQAIAARCDYSSQSIRNWQEGKCEVPLRVADFVHQIYVLFQLDRKD